MEPKKECGCLWILGAERLKDADVSFHVVIYPNV